MQQTLTVELAIPIPADRVMIKRSELEELKRESLAGVYWSMKDLERRIGKKQEWIKDNILFPSKFKKILDSDNGGFVYYPRSQGQTWCFQANKMSDFLDKHFSSIFRSD